MEGALGAILVEDFLGWHGDSGDFFQHPNVRRRLPKAIALVAQADHRCNELVIRAVSEQESPLLVDQRRDAAAFPSRNVLQGPFSDLLERVALQDIASELMLFAVQFLVSKPIARHNANMRFAMEVKEKMAFSSLH